LIFISISNSALILLVNDGKYSMGRTILFLVFVAMTLTGGWLVWKRSGNYDVDFFTKILGWILLIPGILGIMESLRIIQ
tara:strand:- start:205 stop:441 length:237 start_codon:yes stop_codon:yes gene_type:complete